MEIRLIVIRTGDMQKQVEFYNQLGIDFIQHRHGDGPLHHSAQVGETVFEMYPLAKNQTVADKYIRLGFAIDNFDRRLDALKKAGSIFAEPAEHGFGIMTVVTDPDGRKVEIYKK